MMYQDKFVTAIKVNNKILRENGDTIAIPFGSEYSLLIKNLNSVKALVRVWIDGTDVTDGTQLVVNPNQSLDLERFIKNGNMDEGNKFKFIERTAAVSAHRGNKIDDGLIRVEFEFAIPPAAYVNPPRSPWPLPWPHYYDTIANTNSSDERQITASAGPMRGSGSAALNKATAAPQETYVAPQQGEIGITVAGDISDQKFTPTAWFATDGVKHVMVLRVLGEVGGEPVMAPVIVRTKPICTSCGRTNKAGTKFCSECGTSLQIV